MTSGGRDGLAHLQGPAPSDERVVAQQLGRCSEVVGLQDRVAAGRAVRDTVRDPLAGDDGGVQERGAGVDQR